MRPRSDSHTQTKKRIISSKLIHYILSPIPRYQLTLRSMPLEHLLASLNDYSDNIQHYDLANRVSMAIAAENTYAGILHKLNKPTLQDSFIKFIDDVCEAVIAGNITIFDNLKMLSSSHQTIMSDYSLESVSPNQHGMQTIYTTVVYQLALKKYPVFMFNLIQHIGAYLGQYVVNTYAKLGQFDKLNQILGMIELTMTASDLELLYNAIYKGINENENFKKNPTYVIDLLLAIQHKDLRNNIMRKAKRYHPNIQDEIDRQLKLRELKLYPRIKILEQKISIACESHKNIRKTSETKNIATDINIYRDHERDVFTQLEMILEAEAPSNARDQLLRAVTSVLNNRITDGDLHFTVSLPTQSDLANYPLTNYTLDTFTRCANIGLYIYNMQIFLADMEKSIINTQFKARTGIYGKLFNKWPDNNAPSEIQEIRDIINRCKPQESLTHQIAAYDLIKAVLRKIEVKLKFAETRNNIDSLPGTQLTTVEFYKKWITQVSIVENTICSSLFLLQDQSSFKISLPTNINTNNDWDEAVKINPISVTYTSPPEFGIGSLEWLITQFAHTDSLHQLAPRTGLKP